jgi:hypothetical protein
MAAYVFDFAMIDSCIYFQFFCVFPGQLSERLPVVQARPPLDAEVGSARRLRDGFSIPYQRGMLAPSDVRRSAKQQYLVYVAQHNVPCSHWPC